MTANARPVSRRMKRKTLYVAATIASMLAYVVLMALSHSAQWLVWLALAAALVSVVFACLWVAALDEAAQQAHYIAWFWGGSAGLFVSMLVFVTVMLRPSAFDGALTSMGVEESFASGIVVGVTPAVIGYLIWWAVIWLRRS